MKWRFFLFVCLVLLGLILYEEERRVKSIKELLQRMQDKWFNSPVENR